MDEVAEDRPLVAEFVVDANHVVADVERSGSVGDVLVLAGYVGHWEDGRIQVEDAVIVEERCRNDLRILTPADVALSFEERWSIPAAAWSESQGLQLRLVVGR